MKKADMREEYTRADLPGLARGKFFQEAMQGATVVVLDPELAKAFPTSEAVNNALAGLLSIASEARKLTEKPESKKSTAPTKTPRVSKKHASA